MANIYDRGDGVRLIARFDDNASPVTPIDPTTVTLRIKQPNSSVITSYVYGVDADMKKDETGVYHYDLLMDIVGVWWIRWEGSGPVPTVEEMPITVRPSNF